MSGNIILLNEEKASEMIGLKVKTLRVRRWKGLPPRFLKVGSRVFYDKNDLQEYLKTCLRESTTQKESPF